MTKTLSKNYDGAQRKLMAQAYKRRISSSFIPLEEAQIESKISGSEYFVTRKIDGEMAVVFVSDGKAVLVNSGGSERQDLACAQQSVDALNKAGVKSAVFVAELHVDESKGRTRIHDLLAALADPSRQATLHLAPFDIIEWDGIPFKPSGYAETHQKLIDTFNQPLVKPVLMKKVDSRKSIAALFKELVSEGDAEGIVVRCDMPMIYKVKPKHTVDAVVIGYTKGDGENANKVRDLLFAVMHEDGKLQVIGKTGNGFSDEVKASLLARLSAIPANSRFIETDGRNVAFYMVQPQLVVEVGFTDLLTENASAVKKTNALIEYTESGYRTLGSENGVSLLHPVFERLREDKAVNNVDVRVSQITDLCCLSGDEGAQTSLPESTVLRREVYRKGTGEKLMVQKFIAWKTNKDVASSRFPAYVFHYTDFSCGRKEMLKRDIRVSSSEEQIIKIFDEFVQDGIKKGWDKFE